MQYVMVIDIFTKHRIHRVNLLPVLTLIHHRHFIYFLFKKNPDQLNEIRRTTLSSILCQTVEGINEVQIDALRVVNNIE